MLFTRRNFFINLKENILDNIQDSVLPLLEKYEDKQKPQVIAKTEWLKIGHISDFPPDTKTFVNDDKHILVSTEEGFYIKENNSSIANENRYLIKVEKNGNVLINTTELAPKNTVFSLILGDLIQEEEVF